MDDGRDKYEKVRFVIKERGGERVIAIVRATARMTARITTTAIATATASIMIAMISMSVISNDQVAMRGR